MIRVAVADLDRRFTALEPQRIEDAVRGQVGVWWNRARVKTFVGIIAERHARDQLQTLTPSNAAPDLG
jgi:hypothetical protein